MSRLRLIAACGVTFLGCANSSWTHPTKAEVDFNRDKANCAAKAGQAAQAAEGAVWTSTCEACMYGKGWKKSD